MIYGPFAFSKNAILAMKLAPATLHVEDTEGHMQRHDL